MASLRSAPALLKAIEGFRGETSGSRQHEEMNQTLARVVDEIHKGSAPPQDSPGRREARSAAAGHREMPAERGHEGGSDTRSNEPGEASPPQPIHERELFKSTSGQHDRHEGGAPPPSGGNRISAMAAPFPRDEQAIRRAIADREGSRPDTHMRATSERNRPGGNEEAVAKPPKAKDEGRVGDVTGAPSGDVRDLEGLTAQVEKGAREFGREAEKAGRNSAEQPEARPPYAQEGLAGDGWSAVRGRAKARLSQLRK